MQSRNELQLQEGIFELLNLFAQGLQLMDDKDEKRKIAELCLIAGRKAKDSTSYSLGVRFLNMGKSLFQPNSWVDHFDLTYNTLLELGECEYLNDNPIRLYQATRVTTVNPKWWMKIKIAFQETWLSDPVGVVVMTLLVSVVTFIGVMKLFGA